MVTYYWSRMPGRFVNKATGDEIRLSSTAHVTPQFMGTYGEWYETLVETIIDVSNVINIDRHVPATLVVGPEVAIILENTVSFRKLPAAGPNSLLTLAGTLSHRYNVYVNLMSDPNLVSISSGNVSGFVRVKDL